MVTPAELEEDLLKYDKPALCLTDHGTMNAALAVHTIAKKHDRKFVPGSEMYVVNDKVEKNDGPRRPKFDKKRHIVVLAMNEVGHKNLIYHSTNASMHFFMKPRVQHEDYFAKSEGLIVLTACMGGVVAAPLLWDDAASPAERVANATRVAMQYREAFGDRFYLEIQPVDKAEQLTLNMFLIGLHRQYGFPLIATNDAHYAKPEHAAFHSRLIAVQNRSNDGDGELFYKAGHHLRSLTEMRAAFQANGTTAQAPQEVELAIQTANELHHRMEGVRIERQMRIPKYREVDGARIENMGV